MDNITYYMIITIVIIAIIICLLPIDINCKISALIILIISAFIAAMVIRFFRGDEIGEVKNIPEDNKDNKENTYRTFRYINCKDGGNKYLEVIHNRGSTNILITGDTQVLYADDGIIILSNGIVASNGDRVEDIIKLSKKAGVTPIRYHDYSCTPHSRVIPIVIPSESNDILENISTNTDIAIEV